MEYPTLGVRQKSRLMLDAFLGYNHNLRIGDSEFYDMKNMTSDSYPLLSPRGKRGVFVKPEGIATGLVAKDSLCYTDSEFFVFNGKRIDMGLNDEPKQLVSMGAYVIILPDKKWFSTYDETWGDIEATSSNYSGEDKISDVSFELCKINGDSFGNAIVSPTAPTDEDGESPPPDKTLWVDTSTTPNSLKQYSTSSAIWVQIATTYIKVSYPGIGANFKKYDGVTISGLKGETLITHDGTEIEDKDIAAIDGSFVVWEVDEDNGYIVIIGMLSNSRTLQNKVTISRAMPSMDFVVESENRLWGCKYGVAANGDVVNEIYACKLGDFKNWNCFMGISTDSYVASVGTDGQFTGAITHLGYPLFYKEGFRHKVYGNCPANYQIQTTACRGVQKGCSKSLAIVNEVLYYKSRLGVCADDGSLPSEISTALGEVSYFDAVAGSHGNKYYISMADGTGQYHLFVYDTVKGVWHKEDNTQADSFCSCRNEMYFIDHADGKIKTVFGSGEEDERPVVWMAESGIIGVDSPDKKYISKLNVRMTMSIGAKVFFYIQYDSMGDWEPVGTMNGVSVRSFTVPIKPKRCDHFRLRIVGEGEAKVFSICKTIEQGSDWR